MAILILSCTRELSQNEIRSIETYFGEWRNKAENVTGRKEILRTQLEFNKRTNYFFKKIYRDDLSIEQKDKVFVTFSSHQSSINLILASKLDFLLKQCE